MTVLIADETPADVLAWLRARHPTAVVAGWTAQDVTAAARRHGARALLAPRHWGLDRGVLQGLPALRVVGRLRGGFHPREEACSAAHGLALARPGPAALSAQIEFVVSALLQMLRGNGSASAAAASASAAASAQVAAVAGSPGDGGLAALSSEGRSSGVRSSLPSSWPSSPVRASARPRELRGQRVALIGWHEAVAPLAALLRAFGAQAYGYEPAVHASDPRWRQAGVEPLPLAEALSLCHAVVVALPGASRHHGLLRERLWQRGVSEQVVLVLGSSAVLSPELARTALGNGHWSALWLDRDRAGLGLGPLAGHPLLRVTQGQATATRETRARTAWQVAEHFHAVLSADGGVREGGVARPWRDSTRLALGD